MGKPAWEAETIGSVDATAGTKSVGIEVPAVTTLRVAGAKPKQPVELVYPGGLVFITETEVKSNSLVNLEVILEIECIMRAAHVGIGPGGSAPGDRGIAEQKIGIG